MVIALGAGGVVGQAGIQLARLAGAGMVVAVARSARAREQALALGADAAVAIEPDDDPVSLAARLTEAAGPADLVLDLLYGVPAAAAARALRPGGRLRRRPRRSWPTGCAARTRIWGRTA